MARLYYDGVRGPRPSDIDAIADADGETVGIRREPRSGIMRDGPQSGRRIRRRCRGARRAHTGSSQGAEQYRADTAAIDPSGINGVSTISQAFNAKAVAVIGDKRDRRLMWLRAMKRYTGKLYSVQIDPNEIPGIEAMGITNLKSPGRSAGTIDYAVSAVPRQVAPRILKDCIANQVSGIGFFTSGFSETHRRDGNQARERAERNRDRRRTSRWSDPNCMGLYNPQSGLSNFPDLNVGARGDALLYLAKRHAFDQLLFAGAGTWNPRQQGGLDR